MAQHQEGDEEGKVFRFQSFTKKEKDEIEKALNSHPGAMRKVYPFDELSAIDDENLLTKHSRLRILGARLLNIKQFKVKKYFVLHQ